MKDALHSNGYGVVVEIDRFWVVCSTGWAERLSGSEEGLDSLVAENDQGCHRPETLGGPRSWDSRSRLLRCNPAGFDIGSGRRRNGWFEASAVHFIYIKFIVGGGACGDVGE